MGSVLGIKKASPETGLKSAAVGLLLCGEIFYGICYKVEVGFSKRDFHIWRIQHQLSLCLEHGLPVIPLNNDSGNKLVAFPATSPGVAEAWLFLTPSFVVLADGAQPSASLPS